MLTKDEWVDDIPSICEFCNKGITDAFIDGKTSRGPWAIMCPPCHAKFGRGLGTGKGQKYCCVNGAYFRQDDK